MHGPSHHPSRGHPSGPGRATSRDPSSAPRGDPSLLLWENPVFSGCRDKDEEGRGFLEGRAAGTVWGNTRQGLCCDKAPAGAGGFEGLSDKGNWGEPAPAALATPKTPFYPERRLPGLGRAGEQRGFVSPRPSSPLGVPWEVQDAAPPCRAFSSPHPSLAAGSWHRICANPAAGAAVPVLEPSKRQRFHPPPVPWLLAERAFPRCCRPGGGRLRWLCGGSAVPVPFPRAASAHAAARPGNRGGGVGKPRFWVSRRHRECAGVALCPLLCHCTSATPELGRAGSCGRGLAQ